MHRLLLCVLLFCASKHDPGVKESLASQGRCETFNTWGCGAPLELRSAIEELKGGPGSQQLGGGEDPRKF